MLLAHLHITCISLLIFYMYSESNFKIVYFIYRFFRDETRKLTQIQSLRAIT